MVCARDLFNSALISLAPAMKSLTSLRSFTPSLTTSADTLDHGVQQKQCLRSLALPAPRRLQVWLLPFTFCAVCELCACRYGGTQGSSDELRTKRNCSGECSGAHQCVCHLKSRLTCFILFVSTENEREVLRKMCTKARVILVKLRRGLHYPLLYESLLTRLYDADMLGTVSRPLHGSM